MRDCPYCAERIQDEAVACTSCGRDLPDPRQGIAASMTRADLADILEAWAHSYAYTLSDSFRKRLDTASRPIMEKWLHPVATEWVRHRLHKDAELQRVLQQVNLRCYQWAILSIIVGVEAGKGQIHDDDVPYCLQGCMQPLVGEYSEYLVGLVEKRWMKEKRSMELARGLVAYLTEQSISLASWGMAIHDQMLPKYPPGESSPLSLLLIKKLNLPAARR